MSEAQLPSEGSNERTTRRGDRWTRRQALTALGAGAALPFATGSVRAKKTPDEYTVESVVGFSELPEAIAVDRQGNKYLTFPLSGEIRRVTPNGDVSMFATGLSSVLLGIAATPPGEFYTVSTEFGLAPGSERGSYRISRDGTVETLDSFDSSGPAFPNGVAIEGNRRLVSDSLGGSVWSVTDTDAEEWVASPLLDPDGGSPPIGANGVALDRNGDLYVSNSDQAHIVRIPIKPDGSAGEPEIWAESPLLNGADGIRFDTQENLYVAVNDGNAVVRVSADKSGDTTVETIASAADGDQLDFPSDLAFGTAKGEQTTLFVVNFAFGSANPQPGLVKIDVGVPGLPLNR